MLNRRLGRRERRRRLYYLREVMARAAAAFPTTDIDWPTVFNTSPDTFARWLAEREDVPKWIPQLAELAYRVPPPPPLLPASRRLLWGILLGVVALGTGAALLLSFWR